jgi:uncharacterized membrane protein
VDTQSANTRQSRHGDEHFAIGLARAFGGALIFSLPMLMTMELWQLGFYIDPLRLALLLLIFFPLLITLSHRFGFEETVRWLDDALDAFVAYAVGFITAGLILLLFAVLLFGMSLAEIINKISVQAVPASIGAMLARSQFGKNKPQQQDKERPAGYSGELFLMVIGALQERTCDKTPFVPHRTGKRCIAASYSAATSDNASSRYAAKLCSAVWPLSNWSFGLIIPCFVRYVRS